MLMPLGRTVKDPMLPGGGMVCRCTIGVEGNIRSLRPRDDMVYIILHGRSLKALGSV